MSQNKGFRHFRNVVLVGETHQIHNKGGVTMAFDAPKHIDDLTADDQVHVAFAFCSSADNFERLHGRAIAGERLHQGDRLTIPGDAFVRVLRAPLVQDLTRGDVLTAIAGDPHNDLGRQFRTLAKGSLTK